MGLGISTAPKKEENKKLKRGARKISLPFLL